MKRLISIVLCIFILLLCCNCTIKESETMETTCDRTVTVINGIKEADIWILPKTEENLKTTLWGKAVASKVKENESRQVPLSKPGDDGLYIFRMIDNDHMYYSAEDLILEDGWTLEIKGELMADVIIEVTDKDGAVKVAYEVSAARL